MSAKENVNVNPDAYTLILEAIDAGVFKPGDRFHWCWHSALVCRTPVREALQRLETQSLLARDGRSLIVASLDHNQLAELYAVRAELEGLAARLAARHATVEEQKVLEEMVHAHDLLEASPEILVRANRRFHRQVLPVSQPLPCAAA